MWQVHSDRQRRVQVLSGHLEDIASSKHKLILQLEELDARRKAVQLERNQLHNLDAPTSNLPNEVLAMIFEAGMDLGGGPQIDFGRIASHVSHRWRSIAVNAPRLWTQIRYIREPLVAKSKSSKFRSHTTLPPNLNKAITYLSRSGMAPIDICIKNVKEQDMMPEFLQSIADHIGHCRSLCVLNTEKDAFPQILKYASHCAAPILESLSVLSGPLGNGFPDTLFPRGALCLRTVALDDLDALPSFLPAIASVRQLQFSKFQIKDHESYGNIRNAFMALHSLSHLKLGTYGIPPPDLAPIELPRLRCLELDFRTYPTSFRNTIGLINAPVLNCISVAGWVIGHRDLPELAMPETICPSVCHLKINGALAATRGFDLMAKLFPNVEQLTLRGEHFVTVGSCQKTLKKEDLNQILVAILNREEGEEEHERDEQVRWPKLRSIAVSALRLPLEVQELRSTIFKLKKYGRPLETLSLPEIFWTEAPGDADALRDVVDVEEYHDESPAPFGRVL
ncbi:hypothetical protein HWV62_10725 [Athelia sp. TMB]|nr:hypothetical protein HWV62_10725 [Athelia sp. TMB]